MSYLAHIIPAVQIQSMYASQSSMGAVSMDAKQVEEIFKGLQHESMARPGDYYLVRLPNQGLYSLRRKGMSLSARLDIKPDGSVVQYQKSGPKTVVPAGTYPNSTLEKYPFSTEYGQGRGPNPRPVGFQ